MPVGHRPQALTDAQKQLGQRGDQPGRKDDCVAVQAIGDKNDVDTLVVSTLGLGPEGADAEVAQKESLHRAAHYCPTLRRPLPPPAEVVGQSGLREPLETTAELGKFQPAQADQLID